MLAAKHLFFPQDTVHKFRTQSGGIKTHQVILSGLAQVVVGVTGTPTAAKELGF